MIGLGWQLCTSKKIIWGAKLYLQRITFTYYIRWFIKFFIRGRLFIKKKKEEPAKTGCNWLSNGWCTGSVNPPSKMVAKYRFSPLRRCSDLPCNQFQICLNIVVTCQKFCSISADNLIKHNFPSRIRERISFFVMPPTSCCASVSTLNFWQVVKSGKALDWGITKMGPALGCRLVPPRAPLFW